MCLLAHLFAVRVRISLGAITLNHCLASGRDKVRQTVRQNHFRVILCRRLPEFQMANNGIFHDERYRNIAKQQ